MRIEQMNEIDLKSAIWRCNARLSGVYPMGILTIKKVRDALRQYRKELNKRKTRYFEFEE